MAKFVVPMRIIVDWEGIVDAADEKEAEEKAEQCDFEDFDISQGSWADSDVKGPPRKVSD